LYALGLVMTEMITGKTPFAAETQLEILEKIRAQDLGLPRRPDAILPIGFLEAILTATNVDPLKRYASMIDFVDALSLIDFSKLPPSFCRPLMRENLGDIDVVVDRLMASRLERSEWPLALSLALTKWNRSDEPQTTVTDQNIPVGLLNEAIAEVEYRREKFRSGVKKESEFQRPEFNRRNLISSENYLSAGPMMFLLLIAIFSVVIFAWRAQSPMLKDVTRNLSRKAADIIAADNGGRVPSAQPAPAPTPAQSLPKNQK
jgi:hypothetical protein